MSTRSTVHFLNDFSDKPEAIVFRHTDGYPESMHPSLQAFFRMLEEECSDKRFDDASMLAARWVVFLGRLFANDNHWRKYQGFENDHPLDFLSVRVLHADTPDIEYRYIVDCAQHNARGMPLVATMETGEENPALEFINYRTLNYEDPESWETNQNAVSSIRQQVTNSL